MRPILIALLLLCSSNAISKTERQYHRIALNVYVVDDGKKFPLYETQKISKKSYDLMTYDDELLSKYKDDFYNIKYIEVIIPNLINSNQQVIIGFKNKSVKIFSLNKFFDFPQPEDTSTSKIFKTKFLIDTKHNFNIPNEFYTDTVSIQFWNYVEISRINY